MRTFHYAVIGVSFSACMPLAFADDIPWGLNPALNDPVWIAIGGYFPKTSTTMQMNSTQLGVGTSIDLQDTLGISDRANAPDAEVRFRIGEKWRIEASYFRISQTGNKTIDRDIQWGDVVFPANAEVSSKVSFSDFRAAVDYSFYKTSDKEVGVGLGLHWLQYEASLSSLRVGSDSANVLAPLPVLSVYGQMALNDQWSVGARLDWLSLTVNQYSGGISVGSVSVLYQPFKHLGFGAGYQFMSVDFQSTSGSFQGKYNQNLQGPTVFLTASF